MKIKLLTLTILLSPCILVHNVAIFYVQLQLMIGYYHALKCNVIQIFYLFLLISNSEYVAL